MSNWFDVDKEGLAKLLERKGKHFAVAELVSNAWDSNAKNVSVSLVKTPDSRSIYTLLVTDDDPDGFANLAHAYTLFAESNKKDKADKRGRFNLGEKLVLAICDSAIIKSTKASVRFDGNGRHNLRQKTETGSQFEGFVRMTKDEYEETVAFVRTLIPPPGVRTVFNGEELQERKPRVSFEASLPTELADSEGFMKKAIRKAQVFVYEPLADEVPSLYELGVPVVETNDKWHIDVRQKVPLNMDRDNVPPSYLRDLRTLALNRLYTEIRPEEASNSWVRQATSSPDALPEAVNHVVTQIYGEKRVIYDPSDPEANKLAVSQGYTVIPGNALSKQEWEHVRENRLALPAGQVTPSPKARIQFALHDTDESKFVPESKWTEGMKNIAKYSKDVAKVVGVGTIRVQIINDISQGFAACYGGKELMYNVGRLGFNWFNQGITPAVNSLLIHELAHDQSGDHLSHEYHKAVCDIAGVLVDHAIQYPEFFKAFDAATA